MKESSCQVLLMQSFRCVQGFNKIRARTWHKVLGINCSWCIQGFPSGSNVSGVGMFYDVFIGSRSLGQELTRCREFYFSVEQFPAVYLPRVLVYLWRLASLLFHPQCCTHTCQFPHPNPLFVHSRTFFHIYSVYIRDVC